MWKLTRSMIKRGEGQIETFNLDIGHAHQIMKIDDEEYQEEDEKALYKDFY